ARAARKWPVMLDMLADGSLHLTAVALLRRHLTIDNHLELLAAARHRTKREVEEIIAALQPQPAVPSTVRKLPEPKTPPPAASPCLNPLVPATPSSSRPRSSVRCGLATEAAARSSARRADAPSAVSSSITTSSRLPMAARPQWRISSCA